jgi:NodT family efflux transporter outer membrane factor (OMF) lipoprotein
MLLALAGCTVGPPYHSPKPSAAQRFAETNSLVNTNEPVAEWWKTFNDPELDHLIDLALTGNYDLQIADARISQSRFQRNIAAADLFPTADANGSYVHSRGSKNVVLPFGAASSGSGASKSDASRVATKKAAESGGQQSGSAASAPVPELGANPLNNPPSPFGQGGLPGATTDLYQVGFDASWEIDVFGGKRKSVQAAAFDAAAALESRRDAQVRLAAETARDYLELRAAQERLRIARSNLRTQNDVVYLIRSKANAQLATEFDVTRAEAVAAGTAASIPPLEAACRRWIHAISTLSGKEPNDLSSELTEPRPIPSNPPEVPIGLPSELIKRRADIRMAERRIAAANARIGVATADLFPKFALVGAAGLDSSSPGTLFNWQSRYFLISPQVAWRIFDAGRILSNIKLQKALENEATLQYQSTLLKAFQEVEDALVTYAAEDSRRNQLNIEFSKSREALDLSRQRYNEGLEDFLTVLDSERTLLEAEDELAQSQASMSSDLISLYKALGGGWK